MSACWVQVLLGLSLRGDASKHFLKSRESQLRKTGVTKNPIAEESVDFTWGVIVLELP